MPLSISQLRPNDEVVIRSSDGAVTTVVVQSVSSGHLDHKNQSFFIDTNGQIHWDGRAVLLSSHREEETKPTRIRKDDRNWREQITHYPDGTPKTFKEIMLSREDGKTFEEELREIVDSGKTGARDFGDLVRACVMWFPRQFPKINNFDLDNDPRAMSLIGYRPAGINEIERFRIFRTGSVVKLVDNGSGKPPRRFGNIYITYFGVIMTALAVAVVVTLASSLLPR